jgi:hypothetical protein
LAATLQSAVNVGIMLATLAGFLLAGFPHRTVFLIGLVPALITLWIRHAVPETAEWQAAERNAADHPRQQPAISDLFRGALRRTTLLTLTICGLMLTAHWAFMFWYLQHLRGLPEVAAWSAEERTRLASSALLVVMVASIIGNFSAAWLAKLMGWRRAIAVMSLLYGALVTWGYATARPLAELWPFLFGIGVCQGVFALFTMYLPPLFPTLLRTTGAGFCYNTGRIAAAGGTVVFGLLAPPGDMRWALVLAAVLFLPAAVLALFLPDGADV